MFFSKLKISPESHRLAAAIWQEMRDLRPRDHASCASKEKNPLVAIKSLSNGICGGWRSFVPWLLASEDELASSLRWVLLPGLYGVRHQTPV
jgi:hypothetical protein